MPPFGGTRSSPMGSSNAHNLHRRIYKSNAEIHFWLDGCSARAAKRSISFCSLCFLRSSCKDSKRATSLGVTFRFITASILSAGQTIPSPVGELRQSPENQERRNSFSSSSPGPNRIDSEPTSCIERNVSTSKKPSPTCVGKTHGREVQVELT